MAMNKLMHPKNPYKTPPNFKELALQFPEFRKFARQDLSGKIGLNFKNEGAVWALTSCLLKKDFDLDVKTVPSHLVPTLPLRLNYILWLSDIVQLLRPGQEGASGIDIGTGACCIYPLVAAKRFSWNMIGTEVDENNFKCAKENVERNGLQDKIRVLSVKQGTFLCGVVKEEEVYDFCMCNPPFYDETNPNDNCKSKRRSEERPGPRNAQSGVNVELTTQGGEIAFVQNIIDDSLKLKDQIRVYTTMLGHKSSLAPLKLYIKKNCEAKISSTMFCQGRTTRWGLAWTFLPNVDLDKADIQGLLPKKKVDYVRSADISLEGDTLHQDLVSKILIILDQLKIERKCLQMATSEGETYSILARKNTWINDRKKRREEKRKESQMSNCNTDNDSVEPGSKRRFENDEGPSKKTKYDVDSENEVYLKCKLAMKRLEGVLGVEMTFVEGSGGKDAVNQLLQYLKNHIK
ncbi:U6 small nuclear RNA (adenine-(43)-N(6))-methyltransferase [Cimex lectularius]|uniref:U6 small nuclear RNA (adenine-(43)-N(6))-methyltransferase n=1 Tax=Cimex lectularius TaxID=79782 RepID=A0A8I6RZU5_CIMLE|nr:U6 small nuclear RNA (adenine-(43)-N(6))-methyltransferase [Cimex lectularius]